MPRPALSAISSAVLIGLLQVGSVAEAQPQSVTQVVMLGTGNPGPDPDRSGPATAIIVNGTPYLIDFGPVSCAAPKRRRSTKESGRSTQSTCAWPLQRTCTRIIPSAILTSFSRPGSSDEKFPWRCTVRKGSRG